MSVVLNMYGERSASLRPVLERQRGPKPPKPTCSRHDRDGSKPSDERRMASSWRSHLSGSPEVSEAEVSVPVPDTTPLWRSERSRNHRRNDRPDF